MDVLNIPGFTAEASLHSGNDRYNAVAQFAARKLVLQPQRILWPRGRPGIDWCIANCVCVSQVNCPCCDWPFPRPGGPIIFF
jgi:hypothetical protein